MTKQQYEFEKRLKQRELQLDLLAQVVANRTPREASQAAGFWLERQAPEGQRSGDR